MTRIWPVLHPTRWGLRIRSALIVAVVIAAGLGIAALSLTWVLYRSLLTAADDAATARIDEILAQLRLDTPAELDRSVLATDTRVVAVQIVDTTTGQVVQSSANSAVEASTAVRPRPGEVVHDAPAVGDNETRLSAATTDTGDGRYTVVVAVNLEEVENTLTLVGVFVAVGAPFIVVLAATLTYTLIGRSLRSVDDIRTRVAAISTADLTDRVPVPIPRDEIAALAETMNAMLARLDAGHTAQQRFVADASHELRSPLTTLTTALELGRHRPELLDTDVVDTTLLPEAQRMNSLIDDLLLLARADEQRPPRQRIDVDLDDLLDAEAEHARQDSTLRVATRIEPVRVQGDPVALQRAVRNLIDNARRYAANVITLTLTRADDGHARIEVRDDGPGIPDHERDKIFDRFYRIDDDRARTSGGSGLGLAIVSEIVTAHHGTLVVEDTTTPGAAFVITLPIGDTDG